MDILKSAIFDTYRVRKDGSAALVFETGELTPADVAILHVLRNSVGVVGFSRKDSMSAQEIKDVETIDLELEKKSKSERLRDVLWVFWNQNNEGFKDFKDFYSDRMEKLIQQIKSKLI